MNDFCTCFCFSSQGAQSGVEIGVGVIQIQANHDIYKKTLDTFSFQVQDFIVSDIFYKNSKPQEITNESSSPIPPKKCLASQPLCL